MLKHTHIHTHTHTTTLLIFPTVRVQTPISHIQGIPILITSPIPRDNPTERESNISESKLVLINR